MAKLHGKKLAAWKRAHPALVKSWGKKKKRRKKASKRRAKRRTKRRAPKRKTTKRRAKRKTSLRKRQAAFNRGARTIRRITSRPMRASTSESRRRKARKKRRSRKHSGPKFSAAELRELGVSKRSKARAPDFSI